MTDDVRVEGTTAAGFEEVRQEFAANFATRGDVGASVAIYVDGELVVDLWGGVADRETGRPWERDTVGIVYSVTKGAAAVVAHLLAESGALDLDEPVATYWPEFAAEGKGHITVAQLLSHQAGLAAPTETLTLPQLLAATPIVDALARQKPLWEPGTAHGYHALTYGWLTGELVRRVTGMSLGTVFAERVAGPLGLDFWIGLSADRADSVAKLIDGVRDPAEVDLIPDSPARDMILSIVAAASDPSSLFARTMSTNGVFPTPHAATWNDPAVYAAEVPAANGISNARSVARLYAACVGEVDGVRILSEKAVDRARAELVNGPDMVTLAPSRFAAGFQLATAGSPMLGEASFGHQGAGGALGFADVTSRVGFGYVQNQLNGSMLGEHRPAALIGALARALR